MTKPNVCIYHGNCADGFTSAWVVNKWAKEMHSKPEFDFHAGVYGHQPPDVTGKSVYLVDFSYKRDVLLQMARSAQEIIILDHHFTAQRDLVDLPSNVRTVFDMERSGAMITWDFFYPDRLCPKLIDHVQDRDLGKFELMGTREIQANVFSYEYTFENWDMLVRSNPLDLMLEGRAIERKHHKDVAELVQAFKRRILIGGHEVWVANIPYTLTSDAGHLMSSGNEAFAACYWDTPTGRVFSLRSNPDGMNVAEVAEQYGGGGHKHAAGFTVSGDHQLMRI